MGSEEKRGEPGRLGMYTRRSDQIILSAYASLASLTTARYSTEISYIQVTMLRLMERSQKQSLKTFVRLEGLNRSGRHENKCVLDTHDRSGQVHV
jgi:hypothetical protein